jgi:hypothetical protein
MTSEQFAHIFLKEVCATYGMPKEIISDRGTNLTAKFWRTLAGMLGTKVKPSTAYHPQTDGQTERMNQTLEQYLRASINYEQNDWVQLLPMAQYAYNSSVHEGNGMSPMQALHGYLPEIAPAIEGLPEAPKAIYQGERLKELHEYLKKQLQETRERMTKFYNQKRLTGPTFQKGSMVYLIRKNISTERPSDKLDYKKLGPFTVKKAISTNNYELELPKTMKIHPVFHISLLEPAPPDSKPAKHVVAEEHGIYEVEKILESKTEDGKTMYLVKWKNYPESDNTWEPNEHLTNAQRKLKEFRQNQTHPSPQTTKETTQHPPEEEPGQSRSPRRSARTKKTPQ